MKRAHVLAVVLAVSGSVLTSPTARIVADSSVGAPDWRVTSARLSTGYDATCVVLDSGRVSCWGSDDAHLMGNGPTVAPNKLSGTLLDLPSPSLASAVSVGVLQSCALLIDGAVSCWGSGSQVGNGTGLEEYVPSAPIALPSPGKATSIVAADNHTCALLIDARVTCWGDEAYGELGNGAASGEVLAPPAPITLPGSGFASAITGGSESACALLTDGQVACWGNHNDGQAGVGASAPSEIEVPTLVGLPGSGRAIAIDSGEDHTCAVLEGGSITCWGDNYQGQLGIGTEGSSADSPAAFVVLPSPGQAVGVSAGGDSTCALLASGAVTCWGENRNGQLGQPLTSTTLPSPSGALNLPAASSISLGARHACALLRNGGVRCWGDDSANQLGTAENLELWEPSPPFQLPGGIAAQQVEAGNKHTCARSTSTPTPTLACWGNNSHGQLGNGSLDSVDSPTLTSPLPTGTAAIGLAAGESFTCARITGSAVTCWGSDQYGKLGNGSSTSNVLSPPPAVTLPAPGTASRLATGDDHACVVLTDGNVSCWGDDYYGQLGNGAAAGSVAAPPAGFSIGGVASAITAGSGHTCAAQTNGDVRCWGDDAFGQLGDGVAASDLTSPSTPLALPAPGDANRVAAGRYHTCALLTDGKITCWGSNSRGQLGRTGASQYVPPSPIVLPGPGTAVDVDTGSYHSCALLTDSTVACWGTSSAAGIDTVNFFESAPTLVALPAPGTATAISTGDDHTCAVLTDGKITCWGSDLYGERGDGEGTAGLLVEPTQSLLFPGQSVTPSLSMVAQSPIRLLETRSGAGFVTVDGQFQGGGLRPAGSTLTLTVGGRAGISATTSAVSLNIAVTGATDSGYVTVYPCDSSLPLASSINFRAGVTIANASFSDLSATGTVCLFVSAPTHLIVDLNGTFPQLTGFRSVTPARLLETRSGVAYTTIDGQFLGGGPRTAQSTLQLDVRGRGGVPASAHSVTLNVTAVNPSARGFITAYPCDAPQPTASSGNYSAGVTTNTATVVGLSASGQVCVYTSAQTDLVVDVTGAMVPGSAFASAAPRRMLETRVGAIYTTADGQFQGIGARTAGQVTQLQILGRPGVDARIKSITATIAIINPLAGGYATVYPCNATPPTASNINFTAGVTIANTATSALSSSGAVCIFTSASADLIIDITGAQLTP